MWAKLLIAAVCGLFGFALPRFLVALGVPLDRYISGAAKSMNPALDWITTDVAMWGATVVIAGFLFGIESQWHPATALWKAVLPRSQPEDERLKQIRRDIYWLKEKLTDHGPYSFIESEASERCERIDGSDHLIWTDDATNQLKRDFINSCRWMMHCQKKFASIDEDQQTRREIEQRWTTLDKRLREK